MQLPSTTLPLSLLCCAGTLASAVGVAAPHLVYPAAALATHYNDAAYVAEINTEETSISGRVDCVLRGTAAEILPRIVEALSA